MNRRAFNVQLNYQINIALRNNLAISLLMLNIDKFKELNDTFGHRVGDSILKKVAIIMKRIARKSDFVTRYGGEEFAIILPYTDKKGSIMVAERIRESIQNYKWKEQNVTVSIGGATITFKENEEYEEECNNFAKKILTDTDKALYYSKETGRNRVTHFDDIPLM